jgi:predicted Zn-dependent protease
MAARVALAALALVVLACLSIALRNVVLTERAQKIAALPDPSPAQVDEAERLFERARLLDPDTRPLLLEGALLARAGRQDEGVASVEQAVRREPDNVLAWGVLAAITREADPARSRAAEARRLELSPPVPPE